jgi:hypothetical protein
MTGQIEGKGWKNEKTRQNNVGGRWIAVKTVYPAEILMVWVSKRRYVGCDRGLL